MKHEMFVQELQHGAQVKNLKWLEKKIKTQEEKDKRAEEERKNHEKT
jgi:hypothetical protein